uniref:PH domain-containing protein n=1 Tax=Taeniopygia guttata TaxID=59729 RepID=A0A674HT89_TAEGU
MFRNVPAFPTISHQFLGFFFFWDFHRDDDEDDAGADSQKAKKGPKFPNPEIPPELPGGPGPAPRGVLARKVLAESDGKKAPWGRRGWKHFGAELRGSLLLLQRDPPEGPQEILGLPHALARPHPQYSKRPHVFLLQTSDRRQFLCQAQSGADLSRWVFGINVAAALSSSPPFPAAVGSRRRFERPILPSAPSRCPPVRPQKNTPQKNPKSPKKTPKSPLKYRKPHRNIPNPMETPNPPIPSCPRRPAAAPR